MNLDEAIEKYKILIPPDHEFYSEEYESYFENRGKENQPEELKKRFEKYSQFQEMYIKSFYVTFHMSKNEYSHNSKSIANSEAVVLGGQAGAGKSRLSSCCQKRI